MEVEKKDKIKSSGITSTITISSDSSKALTIYSKVNRISKKEVLDTLIGYLAKPGASLSMLDDKYQLSVMNTEFKKNQMELVSILKKSKNDSLEILEKNNTNNLKFLDAAVQKIMLVKTNETIITTQNFKLLRPLTAAILEEKQADFLLKETLAAFQATQKPMEQKGMPENKTQHEGYITIEGKIGVIPNIVFTENTNRINCILILEIKSASSNETLYYHINLLEGELTKKLGLTTQESIKSHFSKLNKGDTLKLYGYFSKNKRVDKNGNDITIYVATEILEHISNSENK